MLKYVLIGGGMAFAAAVQPGPFQAYLFSRVVASGWRRTLPASLAPLLSDGPIALLALVLLGQLSPAMQSLLRAAGGVLLFYLAWGSFRRWRSPQLGSAGRTEKIPRTLLEAAVVNLLNPNPYLGWALVIGPVVAGAWKEAPGYAVAVVVAFYGTMVAALAVLILAFGGALSLSAGFQRTLLLVSSVLLAGLAFYQLTQSILFFTAG